MSRRRSVVVLQRSAKRPRLRQSDRILWAWLSQFWPEWRSCLVIVKPQTVIRWHNQGFKLFWRWKSRCKKPGRPQIPRKVQVLIRRKSLGNPTWGAPRVCDELHYLGLDFAESTVAKYMAGRNDRDRSCQSWKCFLNNQAKGIADEARAIPRGNDDGIVNVHGSGCDPSFTKASVPRRLFLIS